MTFECTHSAKPELVPSESVDPDQEAKPLKISREHLIAPQRSGPSLTGERNQTASSAAQQ